MGQVGVTRQTGPHTAFDRGTWPLTPIAAEVRVDETLKGDAPAKLQVKFVEKDHPVGQTPQTASTGAGYQTLFLKRDGESYRFADAYSGSLSTMERCDPGYSGASDAYDKVVLRVACPFFAGDAAGRSAAVRCSI